jgi:hypothetical protein
MAPPVTSLQVTVGVAFIVIAAFSVRPWRESVPYDHLENVVHGTAATIMGLAFASSVVALVWLRWRDDHVVDRVAVAVAVVSLIAPPTVGLLERGIWCHPAGHAPDVGSLLLH